MHLITIPFNKEYVIFINQQKIILTPFPMKDDPHDIKFGIKAPRDMAVNREEIYLQKKAKEKSAT